MKKLIALTAVLLTAFVAADRGPSRAAAPPARPPILGVAHIALKTSDLSKAREFYGHVLGLPEIFTLPNARSGVLMACFKINDHQYVEIFPGLKDPSEDRLLHISYETPDVRAMHDYLTSHGVAVPETPAKTPDGNLSLLLEDPAGHQMGFFQYLPDSMHAKHYGEPKPDNRISTHMLHAGEMVADRAAADAFYHGLLGFWVSWYGGMTDDRTDWVDMTVPNGHDWLEYMLNAHNPSVRSRGVMHHMSLGVPSVAAAAKVVAQRGYKAQAAQIGRDGKWQLNLYDPDQTRVELMEFHPVEKPCCSPILTKPD